MKAALCHEIEENYDDAIKLYEMIYNNYPNSKNAITAEKYAESSLSIPVYPSMKEEEFDRIADHFRDPRVWIWDDKIGWLKDNIIN